MGVRKYTDQEYDKWIKWRADNDASFTETAEHFGVPDHVVSYATYRNKKKSPKAGIVMIGKRKNKKPKFIDIVQAHDQNNDQIKVIVCKINQIKEVMGLL